jgi:MYND finger
MNWWCIWNYEVLKLALVPDPNSMIPPPRPIEYPSHPNGLPDIVALIVTIPTRSVKIIREKVVKYGEHMCVRFYADLVDNGSFRHTLMSTHPIFGTLIARDHENPNPMIKEDPNGWRGTSDLHICFYFPSSLMVYLDPHDSILSVRMSKEHTTIACFSGSFGPDLEIVKGRLSGSNVAYSDFLPGLKTPAPEFIDRPNNTSRSPADVTTSLRMEPADGHFTALLQINNAKEHSTLKGGAKVAIAQSSACTVTVTYDEFKHTCNFPFPVAGNSARVRLSRKDGWMEIIAPLLTPANRNQYDAPCFPLIRLPDSDSTISAWNLPYVNFERLPKLEHSTTNIGWMTNHLLSMYSDRERPERTTKIDFSTNIENVIHALLWSENIAVRLLPASGGPILILKTGVYLDLTSHSIVCDAYVVEDIWTTSDSYAEITLGEKEINFWRSALPAMAERCRTWEHTVSCKYDDKKGSTMCGCGKGKFAEDFAHRTEWKEFQPHVTRVAISPLFALPYLEPTRGIYKHTKSKNFSTLISPKGPITDEFDVRAEKTKCAKCGKKGGKKCAKCQQVFYCSRECQSEDWKLHKAFCKLAVSS